MTAAAQLGDLLADCDTHGIRLVAADDGGLMIDGPREALTAELLARLREHKAELLATLRPQPEAAGDPEPSAWPEGDEATADPCPRCGSWELWLPAAVNSGWRCQQCDPPRVALRLLKSVERARNGL